MEGFINVIKKDPQVRNKINFALARYNVLPCNYRLKIGCDSLIQIIILKDLIKIMGTTITNLDIGLKMKISRVNYLESILF